MVVLWPKAATNGASMKTAVIASPAAPQQGACIQKEQMSIFSPKIDVFLRRRNDAAIFLILVFDWLHPNECQPWHCTNIRVCLPYTQGVFTTEISEATARPPAATKNMFNHEEPEEHSAASGRNQFISHGGTETQRKIVKKNSVNSVSP